MSQPYKECPQCKMPAALQEATCQRCGHVFRTVFQSTPQKKRIHPAVFCCLLPVSLVFSLFWLASMIPPPQVNHDEENGPVTSMSKGYIPGKLDPWDTTFKDSHYLPPGPHAIAAYKSIPVSSPAGDVTAILGYPVQFRSDTNPGDSPGDGLFDYAYDDGWVQVNVTRSQVIDVICNGVIKDAPKYPPAQAAFARQYGKPIATY